MNKFFKSILAISVCALVNSTNAATYRVVDTGGVDSLRYTYSQQFNVNGEMAISGTGNFNFPIQYQYLSESDFAEIKLLADRAHEGVHGINTIEDYDSMVAGNPTANDLYWVKLFLSDSNKPIPSTNPDNYSYQKIGDTIAMINLGAGTKEFVIWDQTFDDGQLTRSTIDFIRGVTDQGWVYGTGSAPYLPFDFKDVDGNDLTYFIRDFIGRAFFSPDSGVTILPILPPTETELTEDRRFGGISAIYGMSRNSQFAVGTASVSLNESIIEYIEGTDENECRNPTMLETLPFELCVQMVSHLLYNTESGKWTIDSDNNFVFESLGILVEPHPDDTRNFKSEAYAVNDSGVSVGRSIGWVDETVTSPAVDERAGLYAVIFKEDKVISITEDRDKYFNSNAYAISNNGIAVGHTSTFVNGTERTKAFYVDTNIEEPVMVIPDAYFTGASSTARAVNNSGKFVGEGEVETHSDDGNNPRRREAYIYDTDKELLQNLNALTECDSAYTIIEARDINDNDVIAATALIKQDRKDEKGNIMVDENGETLREDVIRSIILEPIPGGEIEDCPTEEVKVVRKGAGFGFFTMMSILGLAVLRRTRSLKVIKS